MHVNLTTGRNCFISMFNTFKYFLCCWVIFCFECGLVTFVVLPGAVSADEV